MRIASRASDDECRADINIEFASKSKFGDESMKLAHFWRAAIDVLTTFNDKDYMLGLTSAQTTLGAVGRLVSAAVRK